MLRVSFLWVTVAGVNFCFDVDQISTLSPISYFRLMSGIFYTMTQSRASPTVIRPRPMHRVHSSPFLFFFVPSQ